MSQPPNQPYPEDSPTGAPQPPGYGRPEQGYGQPSGGQPAAGYGQPSGGQPAEGYGQPSGGQPGAGYGQPSGGQPGEGYGQPSGGQAGAGYGQPFGSQPGEGYGQPSGGQPGQGYGPPSGGQPGEGYGPPAGYAQPPGYGQPPVSGQPGFAPQYGTPGPPPKKRSALKIVLIIVGVLVLLCGAGTAIALYAAKDKIGDVVEGAKVKIAEPATLGGRPKVTDPTIAATADELKKQMSSVPGSTNSVGAVYGNAKKKDLVIVAATASLTGSPKSRFDDFTSDMGTSGFAASSFRDVAAGPLGGIARCGDGETSGVKMSICLWSDNGSIGMFMMLFKPSTALEKEFITMRGEVESTS